MRQHRAGVDFGVGCPVRATTEIVRFGHYPFRNISVGAYQKVGFDVLKQQFSGSGEAGAYVYFRGGSPNGLECLFEAEHQPARASGAKRKVGHQRFELGVLLATESTARIGRKYTHLGQRQVEEIRHDFLQQKRMLDRTPYFQNAFFGRRHEAVRLDRKMRNHRE